MKISNGKVKIFICSHKPFTTYMPSNTDHVLLGQAKTIKSDTLASKYVVDEFTKKHNICYGELCNMHYLWKHKSIIPDYIGICHYRRYFNDFVEDTDKIPEIIEKHGCIVKEPAQMHKQNIKVLKSEHSFLFPMMLQNIVKSKFPQYNTALSRMYASTYIYNRNMIILKKQDYLELCDFIFGVLEEFDKQNGIIDNETTQAYVEREIAAGRYLRSRSNVAWQSRLQGYLAERLTDTFIRYKYNEANLYKTKLLFINDDNSKEICVDK